MTNQNDDRVSHSASQQSLIRHFSISGLFGYRTLSLDSEYAATILIARNGAGKTTMLGALDAFLRCHFGRLADLDFEKIECEINNVGRRLVLRKQDLISYMARISETGQLAKQAKILEVDLADFVFFVSWEFPVISGRRDELLQHPVFYKVYSQSSHTYDSAHSLFESICSDVIDSSSPIVNLRASVSKALAGIEIVYLPTYRRIELALPETEDAKYSYRKPVSVHAKLGLTRRGLHAGDIQFGLSDISARLKALHHEIMIESNQKYAEISANIVDDLISDSLEVQNPSLADRPTKEELDIFFDRLNAGGRDVRFYGYYGPYNRIKKPDIDRIYSGNIPANSEKFLTYFLGKLNSVIKKTRQTEQVVEKFIENCNRYLSAQDPTADFGSAIDFDGKELKLDRAKLDVSVWRSNPEKEIPLDALSSGEKQMVSLFARLCLYPSKKIVLIDEPELSLSLDWQRKILPDILTADLCAQVIAITHSPFIFDNELDVYAKGLGVKFANK